MPVALLRPLWKTIFQKKLRGSFQKHPFRCCIRSQPFLKIEGVLRKRPVALLRPLLEDHTPRKKLGGLFENIRSAVASAPNPS